MTCCLSFFLFIYFFGFPLVGIILGSFQAPNECCNKYKCMNVTNSILAISCVVSCMYTFILPISYLVKKKKNHSLRITVLGIEDAKEE